MEKKKYEKPAMQVFELKHQQQLLAGSGESVVGAELTDYGTPEIIEWP